MNTPKAREEEYSPDSSPTFLESIARGNEMFSLIVRKIKERKTKYSGSFRLHTTREKRGDGKGEDKEGAMGKKRGNVCLREVGKRWDKERSGRGRKERRGKRGEEMGKEKRLKK